MWPDNSETVSRSFDASAVDLTPASVDGEVHVLYSPVVRNADFLDRCAAVLSDGEIERGDSFVVDTERDLFIQRRAFRRYCATKAVGPSPLSQFSFSETQKGRPYLPDQLDLSFSFASFRGGYIAAWSRTRRVGIDVEDPARDEAISDLAHEYYSTAEMRAVDHASGPARPRLFFQLWTLKEAALKSIGEGLPLGLDAFQFETEPALKIVQTPREYRYSHQFQAHIIDGTSGCAALVTRQRIV